MSKDVILDRYARLYEIPRQLAELGHDVSAFCLDYYGNAGNEFWQHDTKNGVLQWHSASLGKAQVFGIACYPFSLFKKLKDFQPDIIIGASDIPHAALASLLAKKLKVPYVIDLYDNFEGFGQAKLPGFKKLLKFACRHAALVTTTSKLLEGKINQEYAIKGHTLSMPSCVDLQLFKNQEQKEARNALGLPSDGIFIGTAGGLQKSRGIDIVYEAWPELLKHHPNIHLVLAGPTDPDYLPPKQANVHYLGMLPHSQVVTLFSALDIGIIFLKDTEFGRYCFPQKAYEMMAAQLPFVAANVGAMPDLLKNIPQALYNESSIQEFINAISWQIENKAHSDEKLMDWRDFGQLLESKLLEL